MASQFFSDKFISSLPDNEDELWVRICKTFEAFSGANIPIPKNVHLMSVETQREFYNIYAFVLSMLEIRKLDVGLAPPTYALAKDIRAFQTAMNEINDLASSALAERQRREFFSEARDDYSALIPGGFAYEFLETDYKRLQELIDELRTLTSESKQVEPDHKRRLLNRIEKLQQELHKKMSNLDRFWGLFGDAGVALGKFGEDIKPLTDRVLEILKIVARTQARAYGLPAPESIPLLEAVSEVAEDQTRSTK